MGCTSSNKTIAPEFCLKDLQISISSVKYGGAANMTVKTKDQDTCLDICKHSTFRVSNLQVVPSLF